MPTKTGRARTSPQRAAAAFPQTVHVEISSATYFTPDDAAQLLAIIGLPRLPTFDDEQAALELDKAIARAVGWGSHRRNIPKPSEYARMLTNVKVKASALLDELGFDPNNGDPQQFVEPSVLKPFYSALCPLPGGLDLPRWLGTGLGLMPRYAESFTRGWERERSFNRENPEYGLAEPTPAQLEAAGIWQAVSEALAEFPVYLKLVCILADLQARKAESGALEIRDETGAKPKIVRNVARRVLFAELARIHFDAFGCWPKISRDATGERNCPAVAWARATIKHAAQRLRENRADPAEVRSIASLSNSPDAIGKSLQSASRKWQDHPPGQ